MARKLNLPAWAKVHTQRKHAVEIDPAQYMPAWLAELGVQESDIDQYWLSVATECAKLDVRSAVAGTDMAPPDGGGLVIIISNAPQWGLRNHPEGHGEQAAKKGKNAEGEPVARARDHYKRLRGLVL